MNLMAGDDRWSAITMGIGDPYVWARDVHHPDLLLEGPNGEYVFAADAMAAGDLAADLERVIDVPVDAALLIRFSEPVDPGSFQGNFWRPQVPTGNPVQSMQVSN